MRELEAGVAGAGAFGGVHAAKYAELGGVRLERVFDLDLGRATALADRFGATAFCDPVGFFDGLDVVTLATPGSTHAPLGLQALEAGLHLYVEKPFAVCEPDALALAASARDTRRVVAVGHQERVIFGAMGLFDAREPALTLSSVRRGLPTARNRDISCVLDLMIHDLDLALRIAGGPATAVVARGGFDTVDAEVRFVGGLQARFVASREASARERTMRIGFASGELEIDFLAPSFVNRTAVSLDAAFADSAASRDPVGASVRAFIEAVRGRGAPIADASDGARAVGLALAIEAAAGV